MKITFKYKWITILFVFLTITTTADAQSRNRGRHRSNSRTSSNHAAASWRKVTSADDLRKRIVGTVWTCMPQGAEFWYRLRFKDNNTMTLQYTNSMLRRWGYDKDWAYEIREGKSWDTGENTISAQIYRMEDVSHSLSMGALIFFENGDIEFNWLRGSSGGKAKYGDYRF